MDKFINIGAWLTLVAIASFGVIGLIEGGKSVIASVKDGTKIWVATLVSFVLSYIVALGISMVPDSPIGGNPVLAVIFGGTLTFAFIEILGYNMLVKTGFALFDALIAWAERKLHGLPANADMRLQ